MCRIRDAIAAVCAEFGTPEKAFYSNSKYAPTVRVRRLAAYAVRHGLASISSYPSISEATGVATSTWIERMHAAERLIATDPAFAADAERCVRIVSNTRHTARHSERGLDGPTRAGGPTAYPIASGAHAPAGLSSASPREGHKPANGSEMRRQFLTPPAPPARHAGSPAPAARPPA